jgi:hypothetical protein
MASLAIVTPAELDAWLRSTEVQSDEEDGESVPLIVDLPGDNNTGASTSAAKSTTNNENSTDDDDDRVLVTPRPPFQKAGRRRSSLDEDNPFTKEVFGLDARTMILAARMQRQEEQEEEQQRGKDEDTEEETSTTLQQNAVTDNEDNEVVVVALDAFLSRSNSSGSAITVKTKNNNAIHSTTSFNNYNSSSSSRRPFQDHRPLVPVFQHGAFTADTTIKEAMEGDCGMGSNKKRRVSFPTECGYQRRDSGSDASYNGGGGSSSTDFCRSFSDPEGYTTTDSFQGVADHYNNNCQQFNRQDSRFSTDSYNQHGTIANTNFQRQSSDPLTFIQAMEYSQRSQDSIVHHRMNHQSAQAMEESMRSRRLLIKIQRRNIMIGSMSRGGMSNGNNGGRTYNPVHHHQQQRRPSRPWKIPQFDQSVVAADLERIVREEMMSMESSR